MYYSINQIFNNNNANRYIDRMYNAINASIPYNDIKTTFVLTGKSAHIMQGQSTDPTTNIIFITNDASVFTFLQKNIRDVFKDANHVYVFANRILIDFGKVKIEIWKTEGNLTSIEYNNTDIFLQDYAKIPQETL